MQKPLSKTKKPPSAEALNNNRDGDDTRRRDNIRIRQGQPLDRTVPGYAVTLSNMHRIQTGSRECLAEFGGTSAQTSLDVSRFQIVCLAMAFLTVFKILPQNHSILTDTMEV